MHHPTDRTSHTTNFVFISCGTLAGSTVSNQDVFWWGVVKDCSVMHVVSLRTCFIVLNSQPITLELLHVEVCLFLMTKNPSSHIVQMVFIAVIGMQEFQMLVSRWSIWNGWEGHFNYRY